MLAVDKSAGMVVHPAPGHGSGTLVNALLNHCSDLSGIGGVERPGIVHRLDKDTSGIVLVAKNETAHRVLARQFKNRQVEKVYLALVRGTMKRKSGAIEAPIGRHKINRKKMSADADRGRQAQTRYEVLETFGHFSYVRLFPKTGRTHQIRVHAQHGLGFGIMGDPVYGNGEGPMLLHSRFLSVPRGDKPAAEATAPLPQTFAAAGFGPEHLDDAGL